MEPSMELKVAQAFEKIYDTFKHLLWQKSVKNNLSPLQIQVLLLVYKKNCSLTKLAHNLQVSKPTITTVTRTLEIKGYLLRDKHANDGRSSVLRLTSEGNSIALELQEYYAAFVPALSAISAEQLQILQSTLLQVIGQLQVAGVLPMQKFCFNCRYYSGDKGSEHFCSMLNKKLQNIELKLYCEEHKELSR